MTDKPIPIDLVPFAETLGDGREFLRVWAKHGGTLCFVNPRPLGADPALFGIAMVDVVRNAASTYAKATGFDAILDDPNFVGGQFSFWNRNGIRLTQTGVGLVQPNSLLPSLRSSKTQGQANFVNPGIFIYNAGVDVEVTQRLKAVFNVNYLRFHRTESLEYILLQNHIRHDIGWDYSLGIAYRPFLINNVTMTFGASTLQTGRGFRDIFTDRSRNCPPNVGDFCEPDVIKPNKPLYSLFAQLKLVF